MTTLLDAAQRPYRYEVVFTDGTRALGRTQNEVIGLVNQHNGQPVISRPTVMSALAKSTAAHFLRFLAAVHVREINHVV